MKIVPFVLLPNFNSQIEPLLVFGKSQAYLFYAFSDFLSDPG